MFSDELSKLVMATMAKGNFVQLTISHINVSEINNVVKDENDATAKTSFTH